jgi:hypothetical protein
MWLCRAVADAFETGKVYKTMLRNEVDAVAFEAGIEAGMWVVPSAGKTLSTPFLV